MEAKLQHYFLTTMANKNDGSTFEQLYLPGHAQELIYGNGFVTGKKGCEDHTWMRTENITEMNEERLISGKGSVYILGEKHHEYKEILQTLKYEPEKVVHNWTLGQNQGYFMLVAEKVLTGELVYGRVVEQCGNWVTFESGKAYLVIWRNMNSLTLFNIKLNKHVKELKYPECFEESLVFLCKPKLVG